MPLRVLDLFSGACGGWSLGLHRAGFETVAACEIDPWRRAQYAANFPGVRLYDDVRTITADRLRADGIVVDAIVGSPPCQDASTANAKGRGLDGERTGLFFEAVRIVLEVRPRWACLENVPGIRRRGIDRVLGLLEAGRYTCWPLVVGAADLGANHLRKRLVLIAADASQDGRRARRSGRSDFGAPRAQHDAHSGAHAAGEGQYARSGDAGEMAWRASAGGNAPDADETRLALRESLGRYDGAERQPIERDGTFAGHHGSATAPAFGRVDDGLPDKVARACISAYGDSFCPQAAEFVGRAILATEAACAA